MKKFLLVVVVLLLAAAGGVWYFLSFRLDGVIENRLEQAATLSLGTQVSVGAVKTNIRDGSLEISNITVANPPGYKNPSAFSLNNIEAAVDYGSLEVKRVVIDNPEIVIEEMGGQTNFSQMLDALNASAGEPAPADPAASEPIIVIRHFRMNESRAAFESESLDRYGDVKVDAVELNDIRGTPTEVARVIAGEVLSEIAADAAKEVLKAQARKQLDDVEQKVSDKLKDLFGGDAGKEDGD
jgi:hypothetical protein